MRKISIGLVIILGAFLAGCSASAATAAVATTVAPTASGMATARPANPLSGLLYRAGGDGENQGLWQIDSNGEPQKISSRPDGALSPDRKQIVRVKNNGELWVYDIAAAAEREITHMSGQMITAPQWWPAHPGRIVFVYRSVDAEGPGCDSAAMVNVDGSGYQVLDDNLDVCSPPALSPDGSTIALDRAGKPWLYSLSMTLQIIPDEEFGFSFMNAASPAWSHDGSQVAWKVYGREGEADGWSGVAVLDQSQKKVRLLHKYLILGGSDIYAYLSWSPDGKWIAVADQAEMYQEKVSLWVLRTDGAAEVHLGAGDSLIWSPYSRHVVFLGNLPNASAESNPKTRVVNVDDWSAKELAVPAGSTVAGWILASPVP